MMSSQGNRNTNRGKGGSSRGFRNEGRRGGGGRGGSSHQKRDQSAPKTPIILAKPNSEPAAESEREHVEKSERKVLVRKETLEDSSNQKRTDSPKPQQKSDNNAAASKNEPYFVPSRNVKLVDDHIFCEALTDYLTDNSDFLVIGVLGLQSVGKSQLLNSMIKPDKPMTNNDENEISNGTPIQPTRMFRVQTFEKQMLSEHCTNGVNAWISPKRIIYLDSEALFSNSILDRSAQLEKKYSFEFNGAENTAEVHSLQLIAFFMSICHVVYVVQEGPICDTDLVERLKIADLLRPSIIASKSFEEPEQVAEYSPEVVFVHNKLSDSEMGINTFQLLRNDYDDLLKDDQVNFRFRTGLSGDQCSSTSANVILVPDFEAAESDYKSAILRVQRTLQKLHLKPFLHNSKQSEKLWLQHAKKTWEQLKESNFYLEFSRLLRQK